MPKPYYSAHGVRLFHGACEDFTIKCDLLLTDPPYGQKFVSNYRAVKHAQLANDDCLETVSRLLLHSIKNVKHGGHIYVFGPSIDMGILTGHISEPVELIWDKQRMSMGDLTKPWAKSFEKIWFTAHWVGKESKTRGGLSARIRKGAVLRSTRPDMTTHPTQKPTDVLRQLIESSSIFGETVYDPFAGSGSTLIAANHEGRKAIGVEISERYCEAAAKRFERELIDWEQYT